MFVGVGAARVRDLFEQAKQKAPCIIFVDELDALGKARGVGPVTHEEREQTLNQLLVELDGFDTARGRHPDGRHQPPGDPRPGAAARRPLRSPRPGRPARQAGAAGDPQAARAQGRPSSRRDDLEVIAAMTAGFVGADLANIINEAALLGVRRDREQRRHRRAAGGGRARRRGAGEEEPRALARREEAGRLPRARARAGGDWRSPAAKASTRSRSSRAASRRSATRCRLPTEDRFLMTESELKNKIATLLGRPRRRGADLRRGLDRRARRSEQGDRHRAQHGEDLRDEPAARPGQLREGPPHACCCRRPSRAAARAATTASRPRARSTTRSAASSTSSASASTEISRAAARGAAARGALLLAKETITGAELRAIAVAAGEGEPTAKSPPTGTRAQRATPGSGRSGRSSSSSPSPIRRGRDGDEDEDDHEEGRPVS